MGSGFSNRLDRAMSRRWTVQVLSFRLVIAITISYRAPLRTAAARQGRSLSNNESINAQASEKEQFALEADSHLRVLSCMCIVPCAKGQRLA